MCLCIVFKSEFVGIFIYVSAQSLGHETAYRGGRHPETESPPSYQLRRGRPVKQKHRYGRNYLIQISGGTKFIDKYELPYLKSFSLFSGRRSAQFQTPARELFPDTGNVPGQSAVNITSPANKRFSYPLPLPNRSSEINVSKPRRSLSSL